MNDMNSKIRLLYAEDNPQDVDLTVAHFEHVCANFIIETVSTGSDCLARLSEQVFDLLLLDFRLPDMDGLDVLADVRAHGHQLPVVMITGMGDDETVAQALRLGASDYVSKSEPDYLDTLPEILRGLFNRHRAYLPYDGHIQLVQQILYVEPNMMDVELTEQHFASAAPHLKIHAVASSVEALSLLSKEHNFNLILSDLRIPGMNALELMREIKHRGIDLPFIVITGKGDEATAVAILRMGAYDYLVKRNNYLVQLPHTIDHVIKRFDLDQTTHRLNAELKSLNASLEEKVVFRTAEIKAAQNELQSMLNAIPDMLFELDLNGRCYAYHSPRTGLLTKSAEPIANLGIEVLDQASAESVLAALQEANEHGKSIGKQYRVSGPHGDSWFELTVAKKLNGDASSVHFIALSRNISERKVAEAELRKLSWAMEQSPNSIVITDLDANIEYVNETFIKMTGYSREEVIGKNPRILQSGKTPRATHIDLWAKLTQGKAWRGEVINKRKDGSEYIESVMIAPIRQADGGITNYLAIKQDITELKQAQNYIEHQQARLGALIEAAMDAIVSTDEEHNIVLFNQAAEKMFGYRAQDILGQPLSRLLPDRFRASHQHLMDDFSNTGLSARAHKGHASRFFGLRSDGVEFAFEASISKIVVGNGRLLTAILRDVTERENTLEQLTETARNLQVANAQIEAERTHLAERVFERTTQLQQANKAKDSFLATMSHEIRTPLAGLMGMMELLDITELNTKQHELLHTARESANNLLRIVNDILDWSKIEAGKLQITPSPSSIRNMLKSIMSHYENIAAAKSVSLRLNCADNIADAHLFDRLRITQILHNLTSNALKFTEHGNVEIRAERVAQQSGTETIRFSVKDSGIGMTSEQLKRVFQQYEQASNETARMYGGTGLGLAISHRLAELMGGTLSVESKVNHGSIFIFTIVLPIATLLDRRELQMSFDGDDRRKGTPIVMPFDARERQINILIVDDHPVNRMLLKQQLEQLGLHLQVAESGSSALALWQSQHFDLVITDCHMPEIDGYELTRHIRAQEQFAGTKRIPVIAWTANVLADESLRCEAAGMDDILTKPTDLGALRAMLLKWLSQEDVLNSTTIASVTKTEKIYEPPLDFDVLKKLVAEQSMQVEVLKVFNTEKSKDIAALKLTLRGDDCVAVATAAHRIKGAARMVGAKELEAISFIIEQAAKQSDIQAARAAENQLDTAVMRLETEIMLFSNRFA